MATETSGDMGEIYNAKIINKKRVQMLSGLPAEHQVYFVHEDRFLTHNATMVSHKKVKGYENIVTRPLAKRHIRISTYDGAEPLDEFTSACIHAYTLYLFYDRECDTRANPKYEDTFGALITILNTYVAYDQLKAAGLETALFHGDIGVRRTSWTALEQVHQATAGIRDEVGEWMQLGSFNEAPQAFTVVALTSLILIGKNVTEASRTGWFRNRWRAIAKILGKKMDENRVDPPLVSMCQALYNVAAAHQKVRAFIFQTMRALASETDRQAHVVFDRLITYLQWTEMSHIWMITEYLLDENPDVLNFPELSGPEISTMVTALEFLKEFSKEDRPYLKLLFDHNALRPLHSIKFTHFTAAAHAVMVLIRPSMANMNMRFSEGVKAFQRRVVNFPVVITGINDEQNNKPKIFLQNSST